MTEELIAMNVGPPRQAGDYEIRGKSVPSPVENEVLAMRVHGVSQVRNAHGRVDLRRRGFFLVPLRIWLKCSFSTVIMQVLENRRDHQLLSSVMHFPHSLTHSAPSTLCTRPPLFLNQQEDPVSPPLPTTNRRGGPADEQGAVLPITPATEREREGERLLFVC